MNPCDKWTGCLAEMDPDEFWNVWTRERTDGGQEILAQHSGYFNGPENCKFWAKFTVSPDGSHDGWSAPGDGPALLAEGGWKEREWQRCYMLDALAAGDEEK